MELTPGLVVLAALAAAVGFALIRWARRHEPAAPADARIPAPRNTMAVREGHESEPLVDWLLERAFEQTGVSVADDPLARERIVKAAGGAMEDLRTGDSATISLPFLTAGAQGPKHFNVQFKRNANSAFELER